MLYNNNNNNNDNNNNNNVFFFNFYTWCSDVKSCDPDPSSLESCSVPEQRVSVSFPASLAQPTPNSFSAASDSQLYTSCASNVSNQSTSSIPNPQVSVDLPTASMAQLSTDLSPDHHALQSARVPSPTSPSKYGLLCFTVLFTFYHSRTPLYRHLLNTDASLLQIACLIVPGEKPLHSL